MGFKIGDLVWAKMKGFPPWPAQIIKPHTDVKEPKGKKPHKFVQFFGSKEYAWIPDESINLHSESFQATLGKKKSKAYQHAIDELINYPGTEVAKKTPKIKESHKTKKKSTRVVQIIHSVPKKHKRKVLTGESPIKKVSKKRCIDNEESIASSSKHDTLNDDSSSVSSDKRSVELSDDSSSVSSGRRLSFELPNNSASVSSSNQHSVDLSFEDLPGCSSNYNEQYISDRELGMLGAVGLDHEDSETNVNKIGFIGLDDLGRAVFLKLIEDGMDVTLWDENMDWYTEFTTKYSIKLAESPAQLIVDCDVTFCYHDADSDVFKEIIYGKKGVLEGLEEAEKLRHIHRGFILLNSIDYEMSKEINEAITVKSGYYLEAPIVGTLENVLQGTLLVLASGSRKLFISCENCFRIISSKSFFVSCEVGFSSKLRVLLNALTGTISTALSEALSLADKLNICKGDVHTIFGKLLQGDTVEKQMQKMLQPEHEPITPVKFVQEDFNLGMNLADRVSQSMPVTAAANEVFKHARLWNYSDSDIRAIYKIAKLL